MNATQIRIEVMQALPSRQLRICLELPEGSCVADALAYPPVKAQWPDAADGVFGIFGSQCDADRLLHDGDRIELYRALLVDPKAARRERAARG